MTKRLVNRVPSSDEFPRARALRVVERASKARVALVPCESLATARDTHRGRLDRAHNVGTHLRGLHARRSRRCSRRNPEWSYWPHRPDYLTRALDGGSSNS